MLVDEKGWLQAEAGDPLVEKLPTVRTCGLDAPAPLGVCWHWTGQTSDAAASALGLARSIRTYDKAKDPHPASWHVLVAKDGALYQSAAFLSGTWHVGKLRRFLGEDRHVNRTLVGVEFQNAGRLRSVGGRCYAWPWWVNPTLPPEQRVPDARWEVARSRAAPGKGGLYDSFPAPQVASAELLLRALVSRYGWARDACAFGHRDFDYPRKEDPGPLWAESILPGVLGRVFPQEGRST